MGSVNYLLIDESILPEIYTKVIKAKNLLLSGEADSASAAARMAGISRSAYYKYKDRIFEYNASHDDTTKINAKLQDNAGVLSQVMNELYLAGANVLSVNQSIPVGNIADVSITVRIADSDTTKDSLIEKIKSVSGVKSAKLVKEGM